MKPNKKQSLLFFILVLVSVHLGLAADSRNWDDYRQHLQTQIQDLEKQKTLCSLCHNTLGKYCGSDGCDVVDCIDACETDCSWKAVADTFREIECESSCTACVGHLEAQVETLKKIISYIRHTKKEKLNSDFLQLNDFKNNKVIVVLPGKVFKGRLSDGSHIVLWGGKEGACFIFSKERPTLNFGHMWRSLSKNIIKTQSPVKVYTPTMSTGVRGTEYILNACLNGNTELTVLRGTVEVVNLFNKKSFNVTSNKSVHVYFNGTRSSVELIKQNWTTPWWGPEYQSKTAPDPRIKKLLFVKIFTIVGIISIILFIIYKKIWF